MYRVAFAVGLAVLVGTPAVAADQSSQPQTAAKSDNPEDKVVCRFVNSTGSRLSRTKECKTRAQWDRESEDAQDDVARQSARATGDATNAPH